MLGQAAGFHLTVSKISGAAWTKVNAFASDYHSADTFTLALVSSQFAALALWCWHSKRMVAVRVGVWIAVAIMLSVAIVAQAQSSVRFIAMCYIFVPMFIGASASHWISTLLGFRIQNNTLHNDKKPRQFGVSEIMLLSVVAGLLCVFVGWLQFIQAFEYIHRVPEWMNEPMFFPKAVCIGILGGMVSVAAWGVLAQARVILRVLLALLIIGLIGCVTYAFLRNYARYVALNYQIDENEFWGWVSWWLLHTMSTMMLLGTARWLGYRIQWSASPELSRQARTAYRIGWVTVTLTCILGLGYFINAKLPTYLQNRALLTELESADAHLFQFQSGQVSLSIQGPLDEKAVKALLDHPIVTSMHVVTPQGRSMLKSLGRLKYLQELTFHDCRLTHEELLSIQESLPNTVVSQW